MIKNKNILFVLGIFILLVIVSFVFTFWESREKKTKINEIEKEVVLYLTKKYNENFVVEDVNVLLNYYGDEEQGNQMKSSYIYTLNVSSQRLVNFKVIYVDYEDEGEFNKYKKYDIPEEGIYENYIYEYKIKDIRQEIREDILSMINNVIKFQLSFDELTPMNDNILVNYSLDDEITRKNNEEYMKLDKKVSNKDFYDIYSKINVSNALVINLEINDFIDKNNVDEFKKQIRKVVDYVQSLGYDIYDININFKNEQISRITPYSEEELNKIYMIFDYGIASSVEYDDQLSFYVF